jgi:AcrR family transcriptional regulator
VSLAQSGRHDRRGRRPCRATGGIGSPKMSAQVGGRRLDPEPAHPLDYRRAMAEGSDDPVPLRRRRQRKSTETLRTELLSAAATVFARRGYGGASTKEIADLAGTTQASIYRHYGSKADLFVAAVADPFVELIEDYTAAFTEQSRHSPDPYRLTETHIANLYDHLYAKRTAVLALICASGDPDAEQPVRTVVTRLNEMFEVFQTVSVDVWEHGGPYQIEHAKLWHRLIAGMVVSATALEPLFLPDGWYKPSRNEVINVMTGMITSGIFDRGSFERGSSAGPNKPTGASA